MRITPVRRELPAISRKKPHASFNRQMEKIMTKTGEEKRMVVESPRGRRENEVKIKRRRSPPDSAINSSNQGTWISLAPRKEAPLARAETPITISCRAPRITTTCILSIESSSLIIVE